MGVWLVNEGVRRLAAVSIIYYTAAFGSIHSGCNRNKRGCMVGRQPTSSVEVMRCRCGRQPNLLTIPGCRYHSGRCLHRHHLGCRCQNRQPNHQPNPPPRPDDLLYRDILPMTPECILAMIHDMIVMTDMRMRIFPSYVHNAHEMCIAHRAV